MIKLQTPVTDEKCKVGISYCDKILMLGSCFSDSIGKHLADYGFDIMVNPFGTLYNPISILRAIERLSGRMVTDPGTEASGTTAPSPSVRAGRAKNFPDLASATAAGVLTAM